MFLHFEINDLNNLKTLGEISSVCIVAEPGVLSFNLVSQLHSLITVPWGIVTAGDLAALSFVFAKLVLGRSVRKFPSGLIDMFSSSLALVESETPTQSIPRDTATLEYWINEKNWTSLALVGHGEGSHLNLGTHICCGLKNIYEMQNGERIFNGCGSDEAGLFCKRKRGSDSTVVKLGDVKTQNLFLFSCIGLSTVRQVYPSDISLVLELLEGYPNQIVTTDRIVEIPAYFPLIAQALTQRFFPLVSVVEILNDLNKIYFDWPCYLLLGDPMDSNCSLKATTTNTIDLSKSLYDYIQKNIDEQDRLKAIKASKFDIILEKSPDINAQISNGVLPVFSSLRLFLIQMEKALGNALFIELSTFQTLQNVRQNNNKLARSLSNLRLLRLSIEQLIYVLSRRLDFDKRVEVLSSETENTRDNLLEKVYMWDALFSEIAVSYLFRYPFEEVFRGISSSVINQQAGNCKRCDAFLRHSSANINGLTDLTLNTTSCPICGTRKLATDNSWTLQVTEPKSLSPEMQLKFAVGLSASPNVLPDTLTGWLGIEIRDRCSGEIQYLNLEEVDEHWLGQCIISCDLQPELHTMKYLYVRGLSITYLRFRIPGII